MATIRVLLLDDQEVVRRGIRDLVRRQPDMVVAGDARESREAAEMVGTARPDVVVMGSTLVDNAPDTVREILAAHRTRVLVLADRVEQESFFTAIEAGGNGYVGKDASAEELVGAIRAVAKGGSTLDRRVTRSLLDRVRDDRRFAKLGKLSRLSAEEERILSYLSDGLTAKKIGAQLHLAQTTVRNRVSSLLSKLEVKTRAEAVAYLARQLRSSGKSEEGMEQRG
jgi:DNA-binding NarL/FixJ family response regulator